MAAALHLRDALTLMDRRHPQTGRCIPFSLKHYTWNRRTKRGGRLAEVHDAMLDVSDAREGPAKFRRPAAKGASTQDDTLADKRHKPEHFANGTRDFLLPDGSRHRCIIWLITEFNGQPVRY